MINARSPRRPTTATRRARRGAALVEMAFSLVVLLGLTSGVIEFGDAYFKKNMLQGAARETARTAIIGSATHAQAVAAGRAVLTAAGVPNTVGTIEVRRGDTNAIVTDLSTVPVGTALIVRVYAEWRQIGMSPMGLLGPTKVIHGTAVMRKEG